MSNITTIYNTILIELAALIPTSTRIPNAYDLESNIEGFLRKGYGLKVGSSNPIELEFKDYSNQRIFNVVLTREVLRTDEDTSSTDAAVLELLEEVNTIQKDFSNSDQLGVGINIEQIEMGNVSAINYFLTDHENFVSIEADFLFTYTENI